MKSKQTNLSKYMNFTKKTKSSKKGKYKSIIPNFIESNSNKYSNYLQSSLKEEDIFLLKRKLKGNNKVHSHSTSNTNNEINKNNIKMPVSSYISYMSPGNNYLLKKKKNNIFIEKALKNHLMLTSMNNSSIIHSSKDKGLSYSINNISNYQSNQNNINNMIYNNNSKKKKAYKGNNNSNLIKNKQNENDINNLKNNINNKMEINAIKANKDKKYSLTSMNSRKNSIDKEEGDIMKKLNKLNFNGIFKNNNNYSNKKIIYSSKNSAKNISISNLNKNKKLFLGDFFNLKKKGKNINNFLELYFKAPQSSNNRKIKKYMNNKNPSNHHKSMSNNKNDQNPITNNTLSPNNNFSSTNYSPVSQNNFFKTAKVSPRTTFPKKKLEIQSHRVNTKNKLSGNILAFYNNYKKNNNGNNFLLYGHSYNLDNNNSNYINKKNNSQKKKAKKNMSVNMNITSNNNNYNMSNYKNTNNNKIISNSNFPKCSSLNKIKKNNYIVSNNNKKIINPIMNNKKYNENQNNNNNIINNCQININNINYNNFNQSNQIKNNQLMDDKIINLFKKKNLIDISSSRIKKIFSQSQQDIVQLKKKDNKNFTSNNSPINKNSNCIKIKNKGLYINNKDNSINKINKNTKNNSNNNSNRESQKIKNKSNNKKDSNINSNDDSKEKYIKKKSIKKGDDKNENADQNIKEKKYNNQNEILELKLNLQKKNSKKLEDKDEEINQKQNENRNINTISCVSSTTKDCNYYMEKSKLLSKFIKDYYNKYKKYPSTALNFYLYGRLIGQGAFGKVNIGLNVLTGRVVAIKSFNKKDLNKNGENMRKILYETNLMKKLNHPNITKILEMFEDDDYILISMEYINGGNLFSFVKKRRKLSEKTAKFLFRQIILGIKHIHSHKIVHRDIKLENILIDLNNNIKICDFGIGRILTSSKQLLHDKCGTPMYMAPEILLSSRSQGYEGFPVDVWSSGISLYIMLSGSLPFNLKNNESSSIEEESDNNIELQYSIINKEPKHIEKISDEARDLLKGLLNKNPNKRLTIDQILEHPWLKVDENNIKINKKYHLFTKAEMIMLSKTYIDYRNGEIDDLKENFTISNLKIKDAKKNWGEKKMKNISTKSSLLAPYNTLIQDDESISDINLKDSFDDLTNPNINLENDIIVINNKVKEFNLNYELNNNGECDNGMLINSKTGTLSMSVNNTLNNKNDSQLTSRSKGRNDENNILDELNDNEEQEEDQEKKVNKILDEIEKIGYDKEYVLDCVNKNILCHASAVFYLMINYKNI